MTKQQQKDFAQLLFTSDEKLTQLEISKRVGVSPQTINKWVAEGNWDKLRKSLLTSRQTILADLYEQLDELRQMIRKRPEGERYANSKEADTLVKLTSAIRNFELDISVAEVVDVGMRFTDFVRSAEPTRAPEYMQMYDAFIKSLIR